MRASDYIMRKFGMKAFTPDGRIRKSYVKKAVEHLRRCKGGAHKKAILEELEGML